MKEKGRLYNSLRNIGVGFVCQLTIMIFSFATRTIFVRLLGAEYTGVSGLFSNILTLLSLAELGIGNVLIFSLYAPLKNKDENTVCQYIHYFRKLYNRIALAILLIGLLLIPVLPIIIGECSLPMGEIQKYYVLYLLNSVFSYIAVDKVTLIQADQKIYIKTVTSTIASILMHLSMIALLLIKKSFTGYLLIQLTFTLGQNLVLNYYAQKMYPYLKKKTDLPSKVFTNSIIRNIKATFLYKVAGVIINYTDNILISVLFGVSMVGYYSNYSLLISYVMTFIGYITTGIAGSLGNLNAEENTEKSYKMFKNMIYLYNGVTVFSTACYLNIVQGFVSFCFGKQYLLGYETIIAILFSFYVAHVIQPVVMYRESMGMFVQIKFVLVITSVINIILSVVLGKLIGVAGIIVATGISRLVTVAWYEPVILFKQKFEQPMSEYWIFQIKNFGVNLLIIILSFIVCSLLPNQIIWLVVKLIITVIIILVIEYVTMRKTQEYNWLKDKLIGIIRR